MKTWLMTVAVAILAVGTADAVGAPQRLLAKKVSVEKKAERVERKEEKSGKRAKAEKFLRMKLSKIEVSGRAVILRGLLGVQRKYENIERIVLMRGDKVIERMDMGKLDRKKLSRFDGKEIEFRMVEKEGRRGLEMREFGFPGTEAR